MYSFHRLTLTAAIGLAGGSWAQIPPTSFGFPSAANELTVQYASSNVTPGIHFGIDVPNPMPTVQYAPTTATTNTTTTYVLLMVDPDASTPENPTSRFILHWLQPNMTADSSGVLTNTTPAVASYRRPGPPVMSNPHRYIQYLFSQPAGFVIPESFSGFNDTNRSMFNVTNFISEAGLAAPVAANYFLCTNQTGIPANFIAAPDGTYPSVSSSATSGPSATGGSAATSSGPTSATYTGAAGMVGGSAFGIVVAAGVAVLAI